MYMMMEQLQETKYETITKLVMEESLEKRESEGNRYKSR
jgi:hypothetical protein